MAKTRSQTGNITIKKEEEEEEEEEEEGCKFTLTLAIASNTRNTTTKRKSSESKHRPLPAQQVKAEEYIDIKSLLKSKSKSKLAKTPGISQEKINQLINYIVHDNMNIAKASRAVKVSFCTGLRYYNIYKSDPEKKIPSPRNGYSHPPNTYTQEHIENLIRYIVDDKMTMEKASAKANMSYGGGRYHYRNYLKDPNRVIPVPRLHQFYSQDQKSEFISYIVNDKMTIKEASKKARMGVGASNYHYHRYFDDQHPDIAKPSHIIIPKHYTQEQIKDAISYIVNDNMSVSAASRKANMNRGSVKNYYRQYLKDNNMELPLSRHRKRYTQDEINKVVGYIVDDKMTILAASKKAKMTPKTVRKYYHQYLKGHNLELSASKHTQDKKNRFIGYLFDDKMTIRAASKKANIAYSTGTKYYQKYRKDYNIETLTRRCTQDEINELVSYIVDDKMTIKAAANKANMSEYTAGKYYQQYQMDNNLPLIPPKHITQNQINALISYIVDDKMSISAASKKANMAHASGYKYYRRYLNSK